MPVMSQFVSCTDEGCPLNQNRRCHSLLISVDEAGCCTIRNNGPHDPKSPTENYVEITECLCQKCQFWELDESTRLGKCGFNASLAFLGMKGETGAYSRCKEISGQVEPPKFSRPSTP